MNHENKKKENEIVFLECVSTSVTNTPEYWTHLFSKIYSRAGLISEAGPGSMSSGPFPGLFSVGGGGKKRRDWI